MMNMISLPVKFTWVGNVFALSSFVLIGFASGANALDVPCAADYVSYRKELIKRNWSPYPCLSEPLTDQQFSEVCMGSIRKSIGHAEWQDNKGSQMMMPVHHLAKGGYCVEPSYRGYKEVRRNEE